MALFSLVARDSSMQVDTSAAGYQVGVYIGSFLPFILLLLLFLFIIRQSYIFKKRKNN